MEEFNATEPCLSIKRMAWPLARTDLPPLVVMATGRIGPNNWWGECSVFIPKELGFGPMSSVDLEAGVIASAYPSEVEVIDADYMRIELAQRAVFLLSGHLSPIASHTGHRELYGLRYELRDGSKMDIYRLILNGNFIAELKQIATRTKNDALRGGGLRACEHRNKT